MKKVSFEHYCLFLFNIYQNDNKMGSDLPQLPAKYLQIRGPHMEYNFTHELDAVGKIIPNKFLLLK